MKYKKKKWLFDYVLSFIDFIEYFFKQLFKFFDYLEKKYKEYNKKKKDIK